jgi:hypothetical protein
MNRKTLLSDFIFIVLIFVVYAALSIFIESGFKNVIFLIIIVLGSIMQHLYEKKQGIARGKNKGTLIFVIFITFFSMFLNSVDFFVKHDVIKFGVLLLLAGLSSFIFNVSWKWFKRRYQNSGGRSND